MIPPDKNQKARTAREWFSQWSEKAQGIKGQAKAGHGVINETSEILTVFEKAGIGSLTMEVPMVHLEHTGSGALARVVETVQIAMPDVSTLRQMTAEGNGANMAVDAYLKLLKIGFENVGIFRALNDLHKKSTSQEDYVIVSEDEARNLEYLQTSVLRIHEWFVETLRGDRLKQVSGAVKSSGTNVTIATDASIPFGVAVMGEVPFAKAVGAHKKALFNKFRDVAKAELGKDAKNDAINRRSRQLILEGLGLYEGDISIKTLDNEVHSVKANAKRLGKAESSRDIILKVDNSIETLHDRYLEHSRNKEFTKTKRLYNDLYKKVSNYNKGNRDSINTLQDMHAIAKKAGVDLGVFLGEDPIKALTNSHALEAQLKERKQSMSRSTQMTKSMAAVEGLGYSLINKALDFYRENTLSDTKLYFTDANGNEVVKNLDLKPIIEARAEKAHLKLRNALESGISLHDYHEMIVDTVMDLGITNPDHFFAFGGRQGAPLGSEHELIHAFQADDWKALTETWKLEGLKLDYSKMAGTILLNTTGQGLTIGDYDGDPAALMDVTRLSYLAVKAGTKQGLTEQESHEIDILGRRVNEAKSGLNLVKSVARYAGREDWLANWSEHTDEQRKKVIFEAMETVQQVRDLWGNVDGWYDSYVEAFADRKEKFRGTHGSDPTGEALRNLHLETSREVHDKLLGDIALGVTAPTRLNQEMTAFLRDYIGFAGTEVIGRAFNVAYDAMMSISALSGRALEGGNAVFHGQTELALDNTDPRVVDQRLTQMDKLAGFLKDFSQAPRDSMKPRGEAAMEAAMTVYRGDGARAAAESVAGVRTIMYLSSILNGGDKVQDFFGNPLEETLHSIKFENSDAAPMAPVQFAKSSHQLHRRFVVEAASEMARFQTETMTSMFTDPAMVNLKSVSHDLIVELANAAATDYGRHVGLDKDARISSFAELKSNHQFRELFLGYLRGDLKDANGNNVVDKVEVSINGRVEKVSAAEALLMHKNIEIYSSFWSSTKNADDYQNRLEKFRQGDKAAFQGFEFDLEGLAQLQEVSGQKKQFLAMAEGATRAGNLHILGSSKIGIQAKVSAILDKMARPETAATPTQTLAMAMDVIETIDLRSLDPTQTDIGLRNIKGDAATIKKVRQSFAEHVNSMDSYGKKLGSTLLELFDQSVSGNMTDAERRKMQELKLGEVMKDVQERHKVMEATLFGLTTNERELYLRSDGKETAVHQIFDQVRGVHMGQQDQVLEAFNVTNRTYNNTVDSKTYKIFQGAETILKPFVDLDSQRGQASAELVAGLAGGAVGALVTGALDHKRGTVDEAATAGVMGVAMMNPVAAARLSDTKSLEAGVRSAALFGAGSLAGMMTERAVTKHIPEVMGRTRWGAGMLAGAIGGSLAAPLINKVVDWVFHKKPEQAKISDMNLADGAINSIEAMLSRAVEGLFEDVTGVSEIIDADTGENVLFEGDGDWASADWQDEYGDNVASIVRDSNI